MTKLSDTQLLILSAAAQRANTLVLPLPNTLKGGAAQKVIASLRKQGLIEEIDADMRAGEPVWRDTGDGHGVTLVITHAGLAALGVEANQAPHAPLGGDKAIKAADAFQDSDSPPPTAPEAYVRKTRSDTKQAALIDMLRTPDGATIAEIAVSIGWQAHTVRGAIAGALKKKLGLDVTSAKVDGRGRVYRLPAA